MKTRRLLPLLLVLSAGCGTSEPPAPEGPPDRITVDHILIGVRNPRFAQGKRSEDEARAHAYDLLEKLKAGADWSQLKRENSEDPPPGGPYTLVNDGVRPAGRDEFPRKGMVPAFGNVGFALKVGEIGMADFHPKDSPFGFHIIRRVK